MLGIWAFPYWNEGNFLPWRRKWQPTPVVLPGNSHGRRSMVGYSPWGCKESDMTEPLQSWVHWHTDKQILLTHFFFVFFIFYFFFTLQYCIGFAIHLFFHLCFKTNLIKYNLWVLSWQMFFSWILHLIYGFINHAVFQAGKLSHLCPLHCLNWDCNCVLSLYLMDHNETFTVVCLNAILE